MIAIYSSDIDDGDTLEAAGAAAAAAALATSASWVRGRAGSPHWSGRRRTPFLLKMRLRRTSAPAGGHGGRCLNEKDSIRGEAEVIYPS